MPLTFRIATVITSSSGNKTTFSWREKCFYYQKITKEKALKRKIK